MDLLNYKRIIIKVGSSLLIDDNYEINTSWLKSLISDIHLLHLGGSEVMIVSSGSFALGSKHAKPSMEREYSLSERQALSAIGQIELSQSYHSQCSDFMIRSAQVLLCIDDTEIYSRYINTKNTLETLLKLDVIPVINENDTVATKPLSYGDNDRLAARISQMTNTNLLILLSNTDGFYTADPNLSKSAELIKKVDTIDNNIKAFAGKSCMKISSGGMITKILAAEIAVNNGCDMIICNGKHSYPLTKLQKGLRFTLFKSKKNNRSSKERWLINHLKHSGSLIITHTGFNKLQFGKHLLTIDVIDCMGNFVSNSIVNIKDKGGTIIAVGIVTVHISTLKQLILTKGYSRENKVVIYRHDIVLI